MLYSFPKKLAVIFCICAITYLVLLAFINFPLTTLLKPLPIICLMCGVFISTVRTLIKSLLLMALGFSLLGDVMLTLPIESQLEWGIGFFMLAHFSYISLFVNDGAFQIRRTVYFLPVLLLIYLVFVYLFPHLGKMQVPVIIYLCVLTTMVFSAFQVMHKALIIGCGALLFLFSDLTTALSLFMFPEYDWRIEVMLTYYLAQWLLAEGILAANARM